jgi:hypothetical protein
MALPATTQRVGRIAENTAAPVNRRIVDEMEEQVRYFADYPEEIESRLWELDREWDVERVLEANAAVLALAGIVFGFANRKLLVLPAVVTGILLQHALQGWCPPVPIFRRLGIRTHSEIEAERHALKALRGDFQGVDAGGRASSLGNAERAERALSAALA